MILAAVAVDGVILDRGDRLLLLHEQRARRARPRRATARCRRHRTVPPLRWALVPAYLLDAFDRNGTTRT
ncbi:MAG TPA: hypothetical protein VEA78_06660 [Acidimicrobiales bacterium]|nr:hypothetical protein [Acidimicrobiales bacterium]